MTPGYFGIPVCGSVAVSKISPSISLKIIEKKKQF